MQRFNRKQNEIFRLNVTRMSCENGYFQQLYKYEILGFRQGNAFIFIFLIKHHTLKKPQYLSFDMYNYYIVFCEFTCNMSITHLIKWIYLHLAGFFFRDHQRNTWYMYLKRNWAGLIFSQILIGQFLESDQNVNMQNIISQW